ncbi:uncharacterized protein K489DRAFT_9103 [Dissoconium aciculare CBS 342.82]|uniref:Uncharacterized protein n=1 Tax=Dissoconium aciculare CBS 342.82 TaxID=1314786 RepID=A0A6J3MJS7_9PEZI|nr:uncharacterized protein K489DRAFT_9103 [Dissoconium aciculare CBS 342.82]KAF1827197.1 hypothetical protein K489DRAFT_9103 [Dissoconium aciculare CBS 342.82]
MRFGADVRDLTDRRSSVISSRGRLDHIQKCAPPSLSLSRRSGAFLGTGGLNGQLLGEILPIRIAGMPPSLSRIAAAEERPRRPFSSVASPGPRPSICLCRSANPVRHVRDGNKARRRIIIIIIIATAYLDGCACGWEGRLWACTVTVVCVWEGAWFALHLSNCAPMSWYCVSIRYSRTTMGSNHDPVRPGTQESSAQTPFDCSVPGTWFGSVQHRQDNPYSILQYESINFRLLCR